LYPGCSNYQSYIFSFGYFTSNFLGWTDTSFDLLVGDLLVDALLRVQHFIETFTKLKNWWNLLELGTLIFMHVKMIAFSFGRSIKILIHARNVRSHVGNQTRRVYAKREYKVPRKVFAIFLLRKDSKDCLYPLKLHVSLGGMMNTEEKMICLGILQIPLYGRILMKSIYNLLLIVIISA
jgi:hypothetical protein